VIKGALDLDRAAEALAGRLPDPLAPLARIAFNYRWSWAPGGPDLFRTIDPHRWELSGENPVRFLQEASAEALDRSASDRDLTARARALEAELRSGPGSDPQTGGLTAEHPAAFFCAEFGIHHSLPIYSGGLGVLAGDFLKEASDRSLPMVGVGLLYRQGYFHQRIDPSGRQHEHWVDTDPERLPTVLVTKDGHPVTAEVSIDGRRVVLQIWRVDVGRVPLFLLDASRPENAEADQWITARLYVGDRRLRLAQYALLGIGGVRALRALAIDPAILHVNEGHAALAPVELAREGIVGGLPFEAAIDAAAARTRFTTHTPVPAGNELYGADELLEALATFRGELRLDEKEFLGLGRTNPQDAEEPFGMTQLGIRLSAARNGVSRRHGAVARAMWQPMFPDRAEDEVPITHVTNGVHLPTWMAFPMAQVLDRSLGEGWRDRAADPEVWEAVDHIPDEELWSVRQGLREALVEEVRRRSVLDRLGRGEPRDYAEAAARAYDAEVLTIGFARRLVTYKRLHLLTHPSQPLLGVLKAPAQVILAGKAHPSDEEAKRVLEELFSRKRAPQVAERVAYLEDYDMSIAALLVAGCDVWVNLPRPPLEASGTSGMKAALNGALNLGVLDGWWDEAFDGTNGWSITAEATDDVEAQDARDAATLYDLLTREIIPLFYERDGSGVPRGWVARMKASLRSIGPRFNASRMLRDYAESVYPMR
jgi:starch phosphorylase